MTAADRPSATARARFEPDEVRGVLALFGIERPTGLVAYERGQASAPKAVATLGDGTKWLLKRRPPGRSERARVLACHRVLGVWRARGVPVPELRSAGGDSAVFSGGHAYELWRFIDAATDNGGPRAAAESGAMLARLHAAGEEALGELCDDDLGAVPAFSGRLERTGRRAVETAGSVDGAELLVDLLGAIERGCVEAEREGFTVAHGDWHPGNLLYAAEGSIAAVLDFDATAPGSAAQDAGRGALHAGMSARAAHAGTTTEAAMIGGGDHPRVGLALDADRTVSFWRAYAATARGAGRAVPTSWTAALGSLIAAAAAAEVCGSVAAHGRFGPMDGRSALEGLAGALPVLHEQARAIAARLAGTGS